MNLEWSNLSVLVTGGTGSFGRQFIETVMRERRPKRLVVFSRDELKQHEMRQRFPDTGDTPIRYFIGDVRDADRLRRALHGVDLVVHAAALKQVPACEYNPFEAVQTNINGAKNVIDAAIDCGVARVMALSTDKAVNPVNLYGATKLVAEKLFVQGNAYAGGNATRFACVRYGNVVGSRGSVIPHFQEQRRQGRPLTVTDPAMTRFWITLPQGVEFVLRSIDLMQGGEVFVPKLGASTILGLAELIAPGAPVEFSGVRPGEKIHERLISDDEARCTFEIEHAYVIQPTFSWWNGAARLGVPVPSDFRYGSDTCRQFDTNELAQLVNAANGDARSAAAGNSRP